MSTTVFNLIRAMMEVLKHLCHRRHHHHLNNPSQPPHCVKISPPPVTPLVLHHVHQFIYRWILKPLRDVAYIDNMLHIWSQRHTFYSEQVESVHTWKASIPCYREAFHMHYINSMPSAFENMADYINMWCVVMLNELFPELSDLDREPRTWLPRASHPP